MQERNALYKEISGLGLYNEVAENEVKINPADERIDVDAKYSLMRLSKGDTVSKEAATGLINTINAGELGGIYGDSMMASVKYAKGHKTNWWRMIAKGEDGCLVLNPNDLLKGTPIIIFRSQQNAPPFDGIRKIPARLDAALVRAWQSFKKWQKGDFTYAGKNKPRHNINLPLIVAESETALQSGVPRNIYPAEDLKTVTKTPPIICTPAEEDGLITGFSNDQVFLEHLKNPTSGIKAKISDFVDTLRNKAGITDVTLSYGQFSVAKGTSISVEQGTSTIVIPYQTSNFSEMVKIAYGREIISTTDLLKKNKVANIPFWQPMKKMESSRCFETAGDVAKKIYNNTEKEKKYFVPKTFGGAIATVKICGNKRTQKVCIDKKQEILTYSDKLTNLYPEIKAALDANFLVKAGVMSGRRHEMTTKTIGTDHLPNPEHFLLIFNYVILDNIDCFLFWDSDHFTTNYSKTGLTFPINKNDETAGNITDGFGILFGLSRSFSTAYNYCDLISIQRDYHIQLQKSLRRHRYQVYSVTLLNR